MILPTLVLSLLLLLLGSAPGTGAPRGKVVLDIPPAGEPVVCTIPEDLRPRFPPAPQDFVALAQDTQPIEGDWTVLAIWQTRQGMLFMGWQWSRQTLELHEDCACAIAARWPAYVRWELFNPCADNV